MRCSERKGNSENKIRYHNGKWDDHALMPWCDVHAWSGSVVGQNARGLDSKITKGLRKLNQSVAAIHLRKVTIVVLQGWSARKMHGDLLS